MEVSFSDNVTVFLIWHCHHHYLILPSKLSDKITVSLSVLSSQLSNIAITIIWYCHQNYLIMSPSSLSALPSSLSVNITTFHPLPHSMPHPHLRHINLPIITTAQGVWRHHHPVHHHHHHPIHHPPHPHHQVYDVCTGSQLACSNEILNRFPNPGSVENQNKTIWWSSDAHWSVIIK